MASTEQEFWLRELEQADHYTNWIYSSVRPHLGKRVLEGGCGTGNLTVHLAQEGRNVVGIDIEEEFITQASKRLSAIPSCQAQRADLLSFEDSEGFDSIVLIDALEHFENDVQVLEHLSTLLKPGGNVIIKVPALQGLYCEMDEVIGHYKRYNRQSLKNALETAGFQLENQKYFNLVGCLGWWLNGRMKRTHPPKEQVGAFDKIVPLLKFTEDIVSPPVGLSLIAVGRRPLDC